MPESPITRAPLKGGLTRRTDDQIDDNKNVRKNLDTTATKWILALFVVNFTLPVWGIILLMLAIPFVLFVVFLLFLKYGDNDSAALSYTSDIFYGIKWYWKYYGDQLDDYRYLTPRCTKCLCVLEPINKSDYLGLRTGMHCSHCDSMVTIEDTYDRLRDKVKKEINRKIVTGEYEFTDASEKELQSKTGA